PAAFVRRCLVLHLHLPDDDPAYKDKEEQAVAQAVVKWLMQRGLDHFAGLAATVRQAAAEQLWRDRVEARKQGLTPPGQAEYLDLLRALSELAADAEAQLALLSEIQDFALKKYVGLF
ncbi:MAG: hypothetical protein GY930_10920, partial [bacterium]|nr:hypothetical protein [bacterium]